MKKLTLLQTGNRDLNRVQQSQAGVLNAALGVMAQMDAPGGNVVASGVNRSQLPAGALTFTGNYGPTAAGPDFVLLPLQNRSGIAFQIQNLTLGAGGLLGTKPIFTVDWAGNVTAAGTISGSGTGVSQIIAGTNVTISPVGGTGIVTINSTGGGGGITAPYVLAGAGVGTVPFTINAASGQTAHIQDWEVNGSIKASILPDGSISSGGNFVPQADLTQNIGGVSNRWNYYVAWLLDGAGTQRIRFDTNGQYSQNNYWGANSDGSGAINHFFSGTTTLATAGAKLALFSNAGATKAWIDKDGSFNGYKPVGASEQTGMMAEQEVWLAGGTPTVNAYAYSVTYSSGLLSQETWTDSGTTYLRLKRGYTYSGGQVSTIVTTVYSAADGVTVTAQSTETFSYTSGEVSTTAIARNV